MKAEELIEKESAGIYNTNEPIIPKSKALESVSIVREEMKAKATKSFKHELRIRYGEVSKTALEIFITGLEAKK
jgi:hypothetical protein